MQRWLLTLFAALALLLAPAPALGQAPAAPTLAAPPPAEADPPAVQELVRRHAEELDLRQVESLVHEANQTWRGYGPEIGLRDFLEMYRESGSDKFSPSRIIGGLLRYLAREVVGNTNLLGKLVVLAIVAALLQNLQSAFENEATGKLAFTVVYLAMIGLALSGFGIAVATARQVMETLSGFMAAMLPTLITLLAGLGGVTSAAIFHPIMITFLSTVSSTVLYTVFPLIFFGAVLEIVSGLNENYRLTNLAALMRQGAMLLMGLIFTIFMGVVAVKGVAGAVADGLAMKTAKFAMGSFIPVVGKMFADATDLIFGSAVLLKNGLGMLGAAVVFFMTAFPLLKILSLVLIYQIAAALVQPAGAGQVAAMLNTMARSLQMVFAAVAVVALMFLVGITVIVGAGNVAAMVR